MLEVARIGLGDVSSLGVSGARSATSPAGAATRPSELSFASLIEAQIGQVTSGLRAAETASIGGLKGTVPIQDVVDKVMSAEQALHTAIAVRDKVVAAYLEISRMSI